MRQVEGPEAEAWESRRTRPRSPTMWRRWRDRHRASAPGSASRCRQTLWCHSHPRCPCRCWWCRPWCWPKPSTACSCESWCHGGSTGRKPACLSAHLLEGSCWGPHRLREPWSRPTRTCSCPGSGPCCEDGRGAQRQAPRGWQAGLCRRPWCQGPPNWRGPTWREASDGLENPRRMKREDDKLRGFIPYTVSSVADLFPSLLWFLVRSGGVFNCLNKFNKPYCPCPVGSVYVRCLWRNTENYCKDTLQKKPCRNPSSEQGLGRIERHRGRNFPHSRDV